MTAAPNGSSIFPFAVPTQPLTAEFLQDAYVQLLELIASQCAAASGATLTSPTITNPTITGATISSVASGQTGTFTANGVTAVTVANTVVTANSAIIVTLKTVGGTVGAIPAIKTITPGTGFTIAGTASDTSVYNYTIIG